MAFDACFLFVERHMHQAVAESLGLQTERARVMSALLSLLDKAK
jgi:hypothetical protein